MHLKGQVYYTRVVTAAAQTGGFEYNLLLLGETDAQNSMSQSEAETKYASYAADIKADFGANTRLINFPRETYAGDTAMRAAFASLILNDANIIDGGDLRPLDIANTGGDGTHIQTDSQIQQASTIIYDAFIGQSVVTISGIPDGTHNLFLINQSTGLIAYNANAVFSGGSTSVNLNAATGVVLKGYVDDGTNTSPVGGRVLKVV